jgi:hypothetical protein
METPLTLTAFLSCAMCLGGADGELAMAANTAIGLMLSVLVVVLGSFLAFIFSLAKKSRMVAAEEAESSSGSEG